jgi:hypothetical protein
MGNNHFKGISILKALPSNTKNSIVALAVRNELHFLCKFELDEKYELSKTLTIRKRMEGEKTRR